MRVAALIMFAALAQAQQLTVSVLATTDLHGNIYPVDYTTGRPAPRGLAKIATLVRAARAENPNSLLIDCGDTIQGTPLEYVYQTIARTGSAPLGLKPAVALTADPMMLAMNKLGYDAMTLGNHEFNFGLKNLNGARDTAKFPWLSANTIGGPVPFARTFLKSVGGVRVVVIGVTTPVIPQWEKPENFGTYRFISPIEIVRKEIAEAKADLVIVAAHSGMGPEEPDENFVRELASKVPGIDAIVFGHSHKELEGQTIGGALVVQPRNWGMSLARLDFTMQRQGRRWTVAGKKSRLIPVRAETEAAPDILELARPYHELAEAYLSTPVATSAAEYSGALGRVGDSALIEAIHEAQLYYTKADVSFTRSSTNPCASRRGR
jgi:2',3'-cyclic-nucleotide 2'-phosphodiesterase/3'-nucleotidase